MVRAARRRTARPRFPTTATVPPLHPTAISRALLIAFACLAPALAAGAAQTVDVTWQSLTSIAEMLTGQRSARDLGGPIKIAEVSGEAASLGLAPLVTLMALLSVSLGLLNLFPIPILDGGHLVFYALEAIRGRPLPPKAQEYGYRAGFALLATLFVLVSWNDIVHGSIGRFVARLVG